MINEQNLEDNQSLFNIERLYSRTATDYSSDYEYP